MFSRNVLAVFGILVLCGIVYAQATGEPSTLPASAPATAPAPRKVVTAPKGFEIYTVNDIRILAEPADEQWIRAAVMALPAGGAATTRAATTAAAPITGSTTGPASPATKPATDVAGRLRERRDELIRQLTADLALSEQKLAADFVDTKLQPKLQALADLKVPTVFMVTTRERLTAVMKAGWDEERFYLNRITGEVGFNPTFQLTTDRPMDDLLVPAIFDPQMNANDRGEMLKAIIGSTQGSIRNEVINRSASEFNAATINFMLETAINPLKLKDDQRWFAQGVTSVLGAKYLADLLGVNRDELLGSMVAEPQGGMSIGAVDLLHPMAIENLKRAFVPVYLDATRRKSAIVVHYLLKKSGEDSIARILTAIRPKTPADGAALVKAIKDQTGQDLTDILQK